MFGDDSFGYAKTNQYYATYQKRYDFHFLVLEILEPEERNLCVQQPAADK